MAPWQVHQTAPWRTQILKKKVMAVLHPLIVVTLGVTKRSSDV